MPCAVETFSKTVANQRGVGAGNRAILHALLCVGVKGVEVKMERSSLLWRRVKDMCMCVFFVV